MNQSLTKFNGLALSRQRKGSLAVRFFDALLNWQERIDERHHLSMLSDAHLRDIGLTRADVARERDKPFWRG